MFNRSGAQYERSYEHSALWASVPIPRVVEGFRLYQSVEDKTINLFLQMQTILKSTKPNIHIKAAIMVAV